MMQLWGNIPGRAQAIKYWGAKWVKNSSVCLEGKSMTSHVRETLFFTVPPRNWTQTLELQRYMDTVWCAWCRGPRALNNATLVLCWKHTCFDWSKNRDPLGHPLDPPGIYVEEEGRTPAAFEVRCPDNFLTPIQRFEKYKDDTQSTKTKCVVPSLIRSLETHLLINVLHDFRLFCLEIWAGVACFLFLCKLYTTLIWIDLRWTLVALTFQNFCNLNRI